MVVSIANITPNHGSRYYTQEGHRTEPEQQTASQWWGKLAPALGVVGQVDSDCLTHLLHGNNPTGEPLLEKNRLHGWQANAKARGEAAPLERAGLDLTTSAPKSVSLQALVFQDRRLEAAHQQATEQMLSFLEERYACTRLTQGGKRQTVLTGQLAIAQFHHDSSRSLDPQLHTHNLILNLQQRADRLPHAGLQRDRGYLLAGTAGSAVAVCFKSSADRPTACPASPRGDRSDECATIHRVGTLATTTAGGAVSSAILEE